MSDGFVDTAVEEIVAESEARDYTVEEALDQAVIYAFNEATQILEQGGPEALTPFSVMVEGDELYVENHPGEDARECFESAQRSIYAMQLKIDSYAFCYDGYVELDDETKDAIIVEAAKVGDESAHAYARLYTLVDDGAEDGEAVSGASADGKAVKALVEDALADLGEAPVLFLEKTPFELEELEED